MGGTLDGNKRQEMNQVEIKSEVGYVVVPTPITVPLFVKLEFSVKRAILDHKCV
jgi:hypothetical protein